MRFIHPEGLDKIIYELEAETFDFVYECEMKRLTDKFTKKYLELDPANEFFIHKSIVYDDAKDLFIVIDESPVTGIRYKMKYAHEDGNPIRLISCESWWPGLSEEKRF